MPRINIQSIVASVIEAHDPSDPFFSPADPKFDVKDLARHLKAAKVIRYCKDLTDELARQLKLREERAASHDRTRDPLHLRLPGQAHTRIKGHLLQICQDQIRSRRLSIPTGWWSEATPSVTDHDSGRRLWVVNAEYRYHYSNRFGDWWTGASYLCGRDDGQYWAVRIPRSITKVQEAVEWHTPAAVIKAQEEGRWVRRQGDVFLVGLKAGKDNFSALPDRHIVRPTRFLVHPEHRPVRLPQGPVRAYTARTLSGANAD